MWSRTRRRRSSLCMLALAMLAAPCFLQADAGDAQGGRVLFVDHAATGPMHDGTINRTTDSPKNDSNTPKQPPRRATAAKTDHPNVAKGTNRGPASDQAGGSPNYFTEQFFGDNDLDYKSILFTPTGSPDFYHACIRRIDSLPSEPGRSSAVGLSNDDFRQVSVNLGATVSLYGVSYSEFYIGTNGYITFGSGDSDDSESLAEHFDRPRISGLYDDLDPNGNPNTLTIKIYQSNDRVVVTWLRIPESDTSNINTFQIEMFFNGDIQISYLTIDATDGLVGLSAGNGLRTDFAESNLSARPQCDCNGNGVLDIAEINAGTSEDLDGNGIPDECDDCNQNGVDDPQDIANGTSTDCNDNAIPDECEDSDCNDNGMWDACDIADGTSVDCNGNTVPDACEITDGTGVDCNGNSVLDGCDLTFHTSFDCTGNGILDECDIANGTSTDCNGDGIPDECRGGCGLLDPCDGPNSALVPVGSNGPHTIAGNEIIVAPGTRVFLEVRIGRWDPYLDGGTLRYYQVTIDSSGYSNGLAGALAPAAEPCTSDLECEAAFGRGATCNDPRGAGVRCTAGFIDSQRDDFALPVSLFGVRTPTPERPNFLFGADDLFPPGPTDPGLDQYAGTLVLDIPKDAQGTFEIGFVGGHPTLLWRWGDGDCLMHVTNRTPALITIDPCPNENDCNLNCVDDGIDLDDGTSFDTDGNGIPDECELVMPTASEYGCRYLAVTPLGDPDRAVALRISLPNCTAPLGYVAADGMLVPDVAVYQTPSEWGTVLVYGADIVPETAYDVIALSDDGLFALPVRTTTARWGDSAGAHLPDGSWAPADGSVDIVRDAVACVNSFSGLTAIAPPSEWCDLWPAIPDFSIDIVDIVQVIDAFRSLPYPYAVPQPCP